MSDLVKMMARPIEYPEPVVFPAWHHFAHGYIAYVRSREEFDVVSDQVLGKLAMVYGRARPWTDAHPFEIPIRRLA